MSASQSPTAPPKPALSGPFLLGIAFSGFFDGILLHQVLQWHHLLSRVRGDVFRDIRVQVLADGLFHVLMYAIALVGLALVWRGRERLRQDRAGARVLGAFVAGFGVWNIVDVGLFHWILQIHNIRLDTPLPIAWDIGWIVVLGLVPAAIGWLILRGSGHGRGGGATAAAAGLAAATLIFGVGGMAPAQGGAVAVLFRPGMSDVEKIAAVGRRGGAVVWTDRSGDLLVVDMPAAADRWRLYTDGAMIVGGAGPSGCLTWSRL